MIAQPKWRLVAICSLLMAVAPRVQAQEVATSFDQLRVLLKRGDTVRVTDTAGREIRGQIAELSSSSIGILVGGNRSDLVEGDVRTISQQRHGNLSTGAKWGFGIGAAFGLISGLASAGPHCNGCGGFLLLSSAIEGAIGSGIGVGISASMTNQHVIYAKPGTTSVTLTVSPLVTRNRQGMIVSFGF